MGGPAAAFPAGWTADCPRASFQRARGAPTQKGRGIEMPRPRIAWRMRWEPGDLRPAPTHS